MMRRPNVVADRMAAQNAAEKQRRRAQLAHRAAAARRRLVLTVALLLATVAGGITVAVSSLSVLFVVVPAVLLGSVLVLGRRAVVLNARADARYARLQRARAEDLAAAAQRETAPVAPPAPEVEEQVVVEQEPEVEAPVESETWTPVPVPAPTYTMKAQAPRMEPAPLDLPEQDYLAASARSDENDGAIAGGNEERAGVIAGELRTEHEAQAAGDDTVAEVELDLDAILDRRRAAGA